MSAEADKVRVFMKTSIMAERHNHCPPDRRLGHMTVWTWLTRCCYQRVADGNGGYCANPQSRRVACREENGSWLNWIERLSAAFAGVLSEAGSAGGVWKTRCSQIAATALAAFITLPPVAAEAQGLPVVTVAAQKDTIVGSEEDAEFVISRTGGTAAALTVHYTLGGDRIAYSNPHHRGNHMVTIPSGNSSASVEVIAAAQADGDTPMVTLTLDDNSAYTVGESPGDEASVTVIESPENSEPTGRPRISGTLVVGETVEAITTDIMDADGLSNRSFAYHWRRADDEMGTNAANIMGATARVYTLQPADVGKHLLVRVEFNDDLGKLEPVNSEWTATAVSAAALVTVVANEVTIAGGGAAGPAVFTFTRTGGSAAAELTVTVSLTGDAFTSNSLDEVTFEAGMSTLEETISTNALSPGATSTTGTVTVEAGTGYTVGTPSSAMVMVTAPQPLPLTIEAWVEVTGSNTMTEGMDESVVFNVNFQLTRPDTDEDFHPSVSTTITIGGTADNQGSMRDFSGCISQTASYQFNVWEENADTLSVTEVIECSIEDTDTAMLLDDDVYEGNETITVTLSSLRCTANCRSATVQFRGQSGASAGEVMATATIEDDEVPPVLSISGPRLTSDAVEKTLEFTIFKFAPNDVASHSSVRFRLASGSTAMEGSAHDFEFVDSQGDTLVNYWVLIGRTNTTATIRVKILADNDNAEGDETLIIELFETENAEISTVGGGDRATLTIQDEALPVFSISSSVSGRISERGYGEDTTVSYTVTKAGATTMETSVKYRASRESSAGELDYQFVDSTGSMVAEADRTLTFAAADVTKTIYVKIFGDFFEDNRDDTVYVELYEPVDAEISSVPGEGEVRTIIGDDDTPGISIDSPTVTEGDLGTTPLVFTVSVRSHLYVDVSISYTVSGTATNGTDYDMLTTPGTLTIPATSPLDASAQSRTKEFEFEVLVRGDTETEVTETVIITLGTVTCPDCGSNWLFPFLDDNSVGTGTILDNDLPGLAIADSPAVGEGAEGDTATMEFVVTLSPPVSDRAVTVSYSVTGGTATVGDYLLPAGSLNFPRNSTEQTISITINGDDSDEDDETLEVTLTGQSSGIEIIDAVGTGTITDDDDPPEFSINSPTVVEGDTGTTEMRFKIRKNGETTFNADIDYSVTGGTATPDADYNALSGGSLAFSAASVEQTIIVNVIGDTLVEADDTVIITISGDARSTIASNMDSGTGTITDDDSLELSISSPEDVMEGDAGESPTMTFVIRMAAMVSAQVTVPFTVGGTAVPGTHYSAITGSSLTFLPTETEKMIDVSLVGNDDSNPNLTIEISLGTPTCSGCPAGIVPIVATGMGIGIGTIINDDVPAVSITAQSVPEGDEGTTAMTFTVAVSGATEATETVRYSIGGTATAGVDYTVDSARLLTFPSGSSSPLTITVLVNGDGIYEVDETVVIELSDPSSGIILETSIATATITNDDNEDDDYPVLSIITTGAFVNEGDTGTTGLAFTVEKTGLTEVEAEVMLFFGGTATEGPDYTVPDGKLLTFAPSETLKTVLLSITGDRLTEFDETVIVTLSSPVNAMISMDAGTDTFTILDDDPLTVSIDSPEVLEGESGVATLTFTVTLSPQPTAPVSIEFEVSDGTATVSDGDYVDPGDGTLTFAASAAASMTIEIAVNGDTKTEGDETVVVTLSKVGGGAMFEGGGDMLTSIGTILSDDPPLVSISSASAVEGSTGTVDLVFVVTLSQSWNQEVSVDYIVEDGTATAGEDYIGPDSTSLTFARNTTDLQQSVIVTVLGDDIPERDETVTVTLSSPVNAFVEAVTATGTGTIRSDDRSLFISSDSRVEEGTAGAVLEYTVSLEPAADSDIEVGYQITERSTAIAVADYGTPTPDVPLVFGAGESSKMITIAVHNDFVEEHEEFVEIMLVPPREAASIAGAVIATARATGVILPRVPADGSVLSVLPGLVADGEPETVPTVSLSFIMNPPRTYSTTVEYRVRPQNGESGAAYANDALPRALDLIEQVSLEANQREKRVVHRLDRSVGVHNAGNLEIVVDRVSRSPGGAADPGISIKGAQVAAAGGGAVTPFRVAQNDRLMRGMEYVLAGTGRSLATGLVDSLWERSKAHRSGDSESVAVLGGRKVDTAALASDTGENDAVREIASLLGIESVGPTGAPIATSNHTDGDLASYRNWAHLPDTRDLVQLSRFALSSNGGSGGSFTFWGHGNSRSYESELEDGEFSSETDARTWQLGVDYRLDRGVVYGVALAHQAGETSYAFANNDGEGTVETGLTSISPWLHMTLGSSFDVWGTVSLGFGRAEIKERGAELEVDVGAQIFAVGIRGLESTFGGSRTAVKADAFTATVASEAAEGALVLPESEGDSTRLRLSIEATGDRNFENGGELSGGLDIGARLDSGEAESGTGVDFGLEFRYASPWAGLEVSGRGNRLFFHSQDKFRETSFGLGVTYDPGAPEDGLQLSLEPTWNASQRNAKAMWNSGPDLNAFDSADTGMAYRARLGYGLTAFGGQAVETVYGEIESGESEVVLRLGVELRETGTRMGQFRLKLYGEREEEGARSAQDAVMLEGHLGY